jgi:hypothetical protein
MSTHPAFICDGDSGTTNYSHRTPRKVLRRVEHDPPSALAWVPLRPLTTARMAAAWAAARWASRQSGNPAAGPEADGRRTCRASPHTAQDRPAPFELERGARPGWHQRWTWTLALCSRSGSKIVLQAAHRPAWVPWRINFSPLTRQMKCYTGTCAPGRSCRFTLSRARARAGRRRASARTRSTSAASACRHRRRPSAAPCASGAVRTRSRRAVRARAARGP